MKFTEDDYRTISELVFRDDYPGYKPEVQESPNGDGVWDTKKRYAHVSPKYLSGMSYSSEDTNAWLILNGYYHRALINAQDLHKSLGLPAELMPDENESCLRILDYPPGATTAPHTDFDLFTVQLYRSHPALFQYIPRRLGHTSDDLNLLYKAIELSSGFHFGEMSEVAGITPADKHHTRASTVRSGSIVFFALPAKDAYLVPPTGGVLAGAWLKERYERSRRQEQS